MTREDIEAFLQENCPELRWEAMSPAARNELLHIVELFFERVHDAEKKSKVYSNRAAVAEGEIEVRNSLVEELVVNMRILHGIMSELSFGLQPRDPNRQEDLLSIDPSMGEALRELGRTSLVTITERKMEDTSATIYERMKQLNDDLLAALGISKERLRAEALGRQITPEGYAAGNFSPFGGVQKVRKV